MGLAKLISVMVLIGLSSSAHIYESESTPEERFLDYADDSISVPASAMSSEELARDLEVFEAPDQVSDLYEKDAKEITDRSAQLFDARWLLPDLEIEESERRKRNFPQIFQQNNDNLDQYFSNGGQSKIPGGQINQGNQGGIIRGPYPYPTGPQKPVVPVQPQIPVAPVQPQRPGVIQPVVPLPGRLIPGPSVRCPQGSHGGYFPVQGDCRSFIHCDRGQPFRKQCGPGTFWNQNLLTCTHGPCTQQNLVVEPQYPAGVRDQRPQPDPYRDNWQQKVPGRPSFGASYGRK